MKRYSALISHRRDGKKNDELFWLPIGVRNEEEAFAYVKEMVLGKWDEHFQIYHEGQFDSVGGAYRVEIFEFSQSRIVNLLAWQTEKDIFEKLALPKRQKGIEINHRIKELKAELKQCRDEYRTLFPKKPTNKENE